MLEHELAHHLSRLFHAETGMTLGSYRTRLRLNLAVEMFADAGEGSSIARIAAATGFADQAHLARTVRRHLGITPSEVRRHLALRGGR